MDPLAIATWALVAATAALTVVAILQWRQMMASSKEAARQTAQFERQAQHQEGSLDVSRQMLAEAKAEREAAAPFSIALQLHPDSVAGAAIFWFHNPQPGVVLRLRRVEVVEEPGATLVETEDLAEGTIGAGLGEGWQTPFAYDLRRVGATYYVRATGQRIGGPMMTREFPFRVGQDGRLIDLAEGPPPPEPS